MAAEPEPVPSDAIKSLRDRINQIAKDKAATSAQRRASREEAVSEFCTKYNGRSLSLSFEITDVTKTGGFHTSRGTKADALDYLYVDATDSKAKYKVNIKKTTSNAMVFARDHDIGWKLREKDILAIRKGKDRVAVMATVTDKSSSKPTIDRHIPNNEQVLVRFGSEKSDLSLMLYPSIAKTKLLSGADATDKPESDAAKP
jgi:hypothetical protein